MDYDGVYRDLTEISKEASHRAAMWFQYDETQAMVLLRFAAECEEFANGIFIRGHGGH